MLAPLDRPEALEKFRGFNLYEKTQKIFRNERAHLQEMSSRREIQNDKPEAGILARNDD